MIAISAILIAVVWGIYFWKFGSHSHLSSSKEVWGQFGDYVGGVINPLLSFVTIILLIQSLSEQQYANKCLIEETTRQEKLDNLKKFENRFFNLIELQQKGFESFFIYTTHHQFVAKRNKLESAQAANYIEKNVMQLVDDEQSHDGIRSHIEEWDSHENLFSLVRRFYLIIKLVDDKLTNSERDEYYETLINLTDIKLLNLICIVVSYYSWDSVQYIVNSKILEREGLREMIEFYSQK